MQIQLVAINKKSGYWKGKKLSLETRLKMSLTRKGKKLPPFSLEHKKNLSKAHIGKSSPRTKEWNKKVSESKIGNKNPMWNKTVSLETRLKRSVSLKGEKSHLWRGGITPINQAIRTSLAYRIWRKSVFERDNYTCKSCGARSKKGSSVILHADHIKQFAYFPKLRFETSNGRTLCKKCHKQTITYAGKGRIYAN